MIEGDAKERYTEEESQTLFECLFPNGFAGEDVTAEIAPEGWEQSALHFVFHPTIDQVYWESVELHRNLQSWLKRDPRAEKDKPYPPEPTMPETTMDEIRADYEDSPSDVTREGRELVARCLWDVFSNGHDVVDREGRIVDLGSFRGTGGFLAEQLNREIREQRYDYMDFYMGSTWVSQRADLAPVYAMIFRRLKRRDLNWMYHFPKLRLIEFDSDRPDGHRSYQIERMKANLRQGHREAIEASKPEPVPNIVLAYRDVYGVFPHGWPPWDFETEEF